MGRPGPETKLSNKMRKAAKTKYGPRLVIVKYHGSAFTESGVSDTLCCLDGMFVAIEVKDPETTHGKKGPTLKQRAFIRRVLATGGTAGVAYNVEQYMEILACAVEMNANGFMCEGHNLE